MQAPILLFEHKKSLENHIRDISEQFNRLNLWKRLKYLSKMKLKQPSVCSSSDPITPKDNCFLVADV